MAFDKKKKKEKYLALGMAKILEIEYLAAEYEKKEFRAITILRQMFKPFCDHEPADMHANSAMIGMNNVKTELLFDKTDEGDLLYQKVMEAIAFFDILYILCFR